MHILEYRLHRSRVTPHSTELPKFRPLPTEEGEASMVADQLETLPPEKLELYHASKRSLGASAEAGLDAKLYMKAFEAHELGSASGKTEFRNTLEGLENDSARNSALERLIRKADEPVVVFAAQHIARRGRRAKHKRPEIVLFGNAIERLRLPQHLQSITREIHRFNAWTGLQLLTAIIKQTDDIVTHRMAVLNNTEIVENGSPELLIEASNHVQATSGDPQAVATLLAPAASTELARYDADYAHSHILDSVKSSNDPKLQYLFVSDLFHGGRNRESIDIGQVVRHATTAASMHMLLKNYNAGEGAFAKRNDSATQRVFHKEIATVLNKETGSARFTELFGKDADVASFEQILFGDKASAYKNDAYIFLKLARLSRSAATLTGFAQHLVHLEPNMHDAALELIEKLAAPMKKDQAFSTLVIALAEAVRDAHLPGTSRYRHLRTVKTLDVAGVTALPLLEALPIETSDFAENSVTAKSDHYMRNDDAALEIVQSAVQSPLVMKAYTQAHKRIDRLKP